MHMQTGLYNCEQIWAYSGPMTITLLKHLFIWFVGFYISWCTLLINVFECFCWSKTLVYKTNITARDKVHMYNMFNGIMYCRIKQRCTSFILEIFLVLHTCYYLVLFSLSTSLVASFRGKCFFAHNDEISQGIDDYSPHNLQQKIVHQWKIIRYSDDAKEPWFENVREWM